MPFASFAPLTSFSPLADLHAPAAAVISERFSASPMALQGVLVAILGLVIGSFLTVVIHRLPIMMARDWENDIAQWQESAGPGPEPEAGRAPGARPLPLPLPEAEAEAASISTLTSTSAAPESGPLQARPYNLMVPRSACPHCGHQLGPLDNLPLLGYVLARGRCRYCHAPIARLYPCVEAITMVLALTIFWRFGATYAALAGFGLCAALVALACIDARTQLLPDSLTLPLLWAGLLLNLPWWSAPSATGGLFTTLPDAVAGAAGGYAVLWAVYWLFRLIRGKEGIGYGDFKLLAALGAWFGLGALPQLILIAAATGSVVGLIALARKCVRVDEPLPFGPYLACAGIVTLLTGNVLSLLFAVN